jgi:hypothetical protein
MIETFEAASRRMTCDGAKKYAVIVPDQPDRVKNLCRK